MIEAIVAMMLVPWGTVIGLDLINARLRIKKLKLETEAAERKEQLTKVHNTLTGYDS